MLKKGIYQISKIWTQNREILETLKIILFRELQLDQIICLPNFSTAILKNNVKSKKRTQDFSNFRSWENIFFVFCAMQKTVVILYLISLS